jgi:hypothetical protein
VFSTAFELRGADVPFLSCRGKTFFEQKKSSIIEVLWTLCSFFRREYNFVDLEVDKTTREVIFYKKKKKNLRGAAIPFLKGAAVAILVGKRDSLPFF